MPSKGSSPPICLIMSESADRTPVIVAFPETLAVSSFLLSDFCIDLYHRTYGVLGFFVVVR